MLRPKVSPAGVTVLKTLLERRKNATCWEDYFIELDAPTKGAVRPGNLKFESAEVQSLLHLNFIEFYFEAGTGVSKCSMRLNSDYLDVVQKIVA
jgi:hypothetical protein